MPARDSVSKIAFKSFVDSIKALKMQHKVCNFDRQSVILCMKIAASHIRKRQQPTNLRARVNDERQDGIVCRDNARIFPSIDINALENNNDARNHLCMT